MQFFSCLFTVHFLSISLTAGADGRNFHIEAEFGKTGFYRNMALLSERAFSANGRGILIFDINDPSNPLQNNEYITCGVAMDVAATATALYVADKDNLLVLNIANPDHPQEVRQLPVPTERVDTHGTFLFGSGSAGLDLYDISNATDPLLLFRFGTGIVDFAMDGDMLYLMRDSSLDIYDLSQPADPTLILQDPTLGGRALAIGDGFIFALQLFDDIIQIYEPATAQIRGSFSILNPISQLTYSAGMLLAPSWDQIIYVFDVTNPAMPVEINAVETEDILDLVAEDNLAFVSCGVAGFRVVDWTNGTEVGAVSNSHYAPFFLSSGDEGITLAIDHETITLTTIDLTDRRNPIQAGVLEHDYGSRVTTINRATLTEDKRHVIYSDIINGLHIVNVEDPLSPQHISFIPVFIAYDFALSGDHLYVAAWDHIAIMDISNPANPVLVDRYFIEAPARGAAVKGDFLFVAMDSSGLVVLDISDPSNIAEVGRENFANVREVRLLGDLAIVSTSVSSFALDIFNPMNPGPASYLGRKIDHFVESEGLIYFSSEGNIYGAGSIWDPPLFNFEAPAEIRWFSLSNGYLHFPSEGRFYITEAENPQNFEARLGRWGTDLNLRDLMRFLPEFLASCGPSPD